MGVAQQVRPNIQALFLGFPDFDWISHIGSMTRESIALFVLVVFLFAGEHILAALHISEAALRAAGGTVLFLIAIRMVFPRPGASVGEELAGEPFIVPLAIPYIAGPSALASVLLIMNQEPERWPEWLLAVFLAWLGVDDEATEKDGR